MTPLVKKPIKTVAFVTDEYPLSSPNGGGLATYVEKTAKMLVRNNYDVHVFLPGASNEMVFNEGVCVHFVSNPAPRFSWWVNRLTPQPFRALTDIVVQLNRSYALAAAVRAHENQYGEFSLIQSCDYQFRGLFVALSKNRKHIIRCSWARDVFEQVDGKRGLGPWVSAFLERLSMRRADAVYAPSYFVANHFHSRYSIPVKVCRPFPPSVVFDLHSLNLLRPAGVPGKYFFHFGRLCERKGTDLVLDISDELKRQGVKILIAGTPKDQKLFERIKCSDVVYLGALSRQEVMSYLLGSLCAILPSRADNLPNTAIESLMLGVPVLTLSKNGVDEIVEDGVNGWVVPMGSKDGLSNVLGDIWCGNTRVRGPVQLPSDMSFDLTFSVFEENINNCS